MDLFVPDSAIDTDEVFSRGGRNFGDEDFARFKCPSCWQVYLIDQSADVVYLDPKDVTHRLPAERIRQRCEGCGQPLPDAPLTGPAAPDEVRVTWDQLRATRWAWVATVEVMLRNGKRMKREAGLLP
jgi:hypothetical protein